MITKAEINGFRGLRNLTLNDPGVVNIFVGRNGAGKTSVLEALAVAANAGLPEFLSQLGRWREMPPLRLGSDEALRSIFPDFDTSQSVTLTLHEDGRPHSLAISAICEEGTVIVSPGAEPRPQLDDEQLPGVEYIRTDPDGKETHHRLWLRPEGFELKPLSLKKPRAFYVHARQSISAADTARVVTGLFEAKREKLFIDALRIIEPHITRVVPTTKNNEPLILVDIGLPRLVPMNVLGDGFCRIALILTGALSGRASVVAVDEIDSGLHYSVMADFWKHLLVLSRESRFQLFCATHNEEMIYHTLTAFAEEPDKLRVYRLDKNSDRFISATKLGYQLVRDSDYAGVEIR